jgi:hypothetical protein
MHLACLAFAAPPTHCTDSPRGQTSSRPGAIPVFRVGLAGLSDVSILSLSYQSRTLCTDAAPGAGVPPLRGSMLDTTWTVYEALLHSEAGGPRPIAGGGRWHNQTDL